MNNYKPFDPKKSYSLLVGVGKREEDDPAMEVSAQDALSLKDALREFLHFEDEKIDCLVNEKAVKSEILDKLEYLKIKTQNDHADLVIIFFSGHGCTRNDEYYLVCNNIKNSKIEETLIEGTFFVEKLKEIKCNKMLVLLDCCHSEGMTTAETPFDSGLELKNRVVITACHKSQVSYLSKPVSVFTYGVIEGLGGKLLTGEDKKVSVLHLAMDVRERVIALSKKILKPKEPQQPQLNVFPESQTSDFLLAHHPKGKDQYKIEKILGDEFRCLTNFDKTIKFDMDVENIPDNEYRNQFNWMKIDNSIQQTGDGGINIKDSQGVTFEINNSLTTGDLILILEKMNAKEERLIEKLFNFLEKQTDTNSKALEERIADFKKKSLDENISGKDLDKKDIIEMINEGNYSEVFAQLDSMDLGYYKMMYNRLKKEFSSGIKGVDLIDFGERLKVFVGSLK